MNRTKLTGKALENARFDVQYMTDCTCMRNQTFPKTADLPDQQTPTPEETLAAYDHELGELGEVWLDRHVQGRPTAQIDAAIDQIRRERRKHEKRLAARAKTR